MTQPTYASSEHQIIVATYIVMIKEFVKDVSNETRWNNFCEVLDILFEYHNNYGKGVKENNWYDWLVIIPINVSVATNGFFAGLETNKNRATIRAYKTILNEMVGEVVTKIDNLEEPSE